MAFTIALCPYCGADVEIDDNGNYLCTECDRRIIRSRSNTRAYLLKKPHEEEYSDIIHMSTENAEAALKKIDSIIDSSEEITTDMYFTRGIVYAAMGEEGKANLDWGKGIESITDTRFLDSYIVAVSKSIVELIYMKEREFMDFNPIEYIDLLSTKFRIKGDIPCKGVFYITIYRNLRMDLQAGEFDIEDDMYTSVIPKVLNRILAYGRNFRTTCGIIEELLVDFEYSPDTYVEDDNLRLHLCSLLANDYKELSKDFSDEHILRIFRHWNDENMFEMEYWVDQLMKSVKDNTILKSLSIFNKADKEDVDLEEAVEIYARKYLLLSETGEDLSQQS